MKVKVIKAFRDKITKSTLRPEQVIEVTEERFGELTGPFGIFVEEIKENPPESDGLNYEKLTKNDLVIVAAERGIELKMEMTKAEMIEVLLKK